MGGSWHAFKKTGANGKCSGEAISPAGHRSQKYQALLPVRLLGVRLRVHLPYPFGLTPRQLMADWSIFGWQLHLVDDRVGHGLRVGYCGIHCLTPLRDSGRYSIWLQEAGSQFSSSIVTERSDGYHTLSLSTSSLVQSQANGLRATFEPRSRLRPRRMTSQGRITLHRRRLNLHIRPALVTSLADRVLYQKHFRASLDRPLRCLNVRLHTHFLGRGTPLLGSAECNWDTPSRPPVLLPHTRFLVPPGQRRYDVRHAIFLERSIQPPTRRSVSSRRLLLIDAPPLGTSFASNRNDKPACLAGHALLFSFKPEAYGRRLVTPVRYSSCRGSKMHSRCKEFRHSVVSVLRQISC